MSNSIDDPFRAGRQSIPPVFLNHFYAVVDTTTYKAIEADPFWRSQFAPNERRTTVRTDETYTGLYFYGANTYFEIFDVADSPRPDVGDCGLAFGVDSIGDLDTLGQVLGTELQIKRDPITRLYRGEPVSWFQMATLEHLPYGSRTSTWLMEYHPEFLRRWNPRARDHVEDGVSRRDVLARYASVLAPVSNPVMHDVVGLTINVDAPTRDALVDVCRRVGYATRQGDAEAVSLVGPDFELQLVVSPNYGVRAVRMRTESALSLRPRQFGRATVEAAEGSANADIALSTRCAWERGVAR